MSALRCLANLVVLIAWGFVVVVVATYDAIRENAKKRRLGRHYEGPLEG